MDKIKDSYLYKEDVESILKQDCNWKLLENKTILLSGATGLIGSILVDMLIFLNKKFSLNLTLLLITRQDIISKYNFVQYIKADISNPLNINKKLDFIIHAASNTHPMQYSRMPIQTITTNVFGTYNLLNLQTQNKDCRFIFLSSVEIYGEDYKNNESGFDETALGYIDCNTTRNCYNESKRLSETLCAAFKSEKNINYVIARLCRSYGPTLRNDDSKALSQFLHNGINNNNIILKSNGKQYFSYIYSADAASAIIYLMLYGKNGEAYNVADNKSNITLRKLASLIAENCNTKIIFDLPDEIEKKGFSKVQRAILNTTKINKLGWKAQFDITNGIKRTIKILKNNL